MKEGEGKNKNTTGAAYIALFSDVRSNWLVKAHHYIYLTALL